MWCQTEECPFIKGPGNTDDCEHCGTDGKCRAPDDWEMNCAMILSNLCTDTIRGTCILLASMLEDSDPGEKIEVQKIIKTKAEFESLPEYDP